MPTAAFSIDALAVLLVGIAGQAASLRAHRFPIISARIEWGPLRLPPPGRAALRRIERAQERALSRPGAPGLHWSALPRESLDYRK